MKKALITGITGQDGSYLTETWNHNVYKYINRDDHAVVFGYS